MLSIMVSPCEQTLASERIRECQGKVIKAPLQMRAHEIVFYGTNISAYTS